MASRAAALAAGSGHGSGPFRAVAPAAGNPRSRGPTSLGFAGLSPSRHGRGRRRVAAPASALGGPGRRLRPPRGQAGSIMR